MIRKTTLFMAAVAVAFLTTNANAADVSITQTGGAGGEVTIATSVTGFTSPFRFTPSAAVHVGGGTSATAFAINSVHEAALGKENGRQFGIASDSSTVFWMDAPDTWTALTSANTNSSALQSYNRN